MGVSFRGFNPCFGGLVGQVRLSISDAMISQCFNPCFGGLVGQVIRPRSLPDTAAGFQSLFWWIGRSGNDGAEPNCFRYHCFNPCFGGLVGQVLFYHRIFLSSPGFNPCFGGLVGQVARPA